MFGIFRVVIAVLILSALAMIARDPWNTRTPSDGATAHSTETSSTEDLRDSLSIDDWKSFHEGLFVCGTTVTESFLATAKIFNVKPKFPLLFVASKNDPETIELSNFFTPESIHGYPRQGLLVFKVIRQKTTDFHTEHVQVMGGIINDLPCQIR